MWVLTLLKTTDGFTRLWPTVACLGAYAVAFAALAWAIKQQLPVGPAYAMWSGLGTAAIVAIGVLFLGEQLSAAKVAGAVHAIAEFGVGNVTHRRIAALAGVPLGSTTYYFPTLDDLVASAMREVTEMARAQLVEWAERLTVSRDVPATFVELAGGYLGDRSQALLGYEIYLAAARTPELRPVAQLWIDGLRGMCARFAGGPERGFALAALVDGTLLQALVTGAPLDADGLRAGVAALVSRRTAAGST